MKFEDTYATTLTIERCTRSSLGGSGCGGGVALARGGVALSRSGVALSGAASADSEVGCGIVGGLVGSVPCWLRWPRGGGDGSAGGSVGRRSRN